MRLVKDLDLSILTTQLEEGGIGSVLHLFTDRLRYGNRFDAISALHFAIQHAPLVVEDTTHSILIEKRASITMIHILWNWRIVTIDLEAEGLMTQVEVKTKEAALVAIDAIDFLVRADSSLVGHDKLAEFRAFQIALQNRAEQVKSTFSLYI